jgi:putative addiction module killer protein
MLEILRFQLETGDVPITGWLRELRDVRAKAQIQIRFNRIASGNFGDHKPVGEGVSELRVDIGAGYRVYFGQHGKTVVVLLCGGDKGTQKTDIQKAKEYWAEWKRKNS